MKAEHKIFFAIPFDKLTRNVYEEVCKEIVSHFKKQGYKLTTIIGNEQITPSPDYSEILSFRAQNTELHRQFFKEIANSDIIVADLTNNNPNVHVELGVALVLNKNILRVTGRPEKELGFDIQNLQVYLYKNKCDLQKRIIKYLELFLKIKRLNFSEEYSILYKKISDLIKLPGTQPEVKKDIIWSYPIKGFYFRDGAIRLDFEFLNYFSPVSWIGIYFRATNPILLGSYLLYVRQNGTVELAENNPNPNIIFKQQVLKPFELNDSLNCLIEIENDQIEIKANGQSLKIGKLVQQNIGGIILASWECQAQFKNIELINRDTIDF